MNNVVTPETARKLKAAGFPQPMPEVGQVWCIGETPILVTGIYKGGTSFHYWYSRVNGTQVHEKHFPEAAIFAPTAPDILRELGYEHTLHHEDIFFCIYEPDGRGLKIYENPNPAEACAPAWINKQP